MKFFDIPAPGAKPRPMEIEGESVVLGESGRGRTLVVVPVTGDGSEYYAKRTDEGIVLVRGDFTSERRALARINTMGGYSRGRSYAMLDASGVTTLVAGTFAEGDAGRLGSGDDVLAIVEPRAEFRLQSKYASHWYRWDGEEWQLIMPEERQAEAALAAVKRGEGEWL